MVRKKSSDKNSRLEQSPIPDTPPSAGKLGKPAAPRKVSPLRQRMIEDMMLAGLAPKTQNNYIHAVVSIQKHHGGTSPDRLTEKQVHAYVLWLRDGKNCSRGAFQTHFYGLKFFYYRCLNYQWPLFTTKRVRLPKKLRLPQFVHPEQARAIVDGLHSLRYKVFASCLYALGLRVEDAVTLNIQSIDGPHGLVRVIGKGNKERLLPLPPALYRQLRQLWLTHRHPVLLFPNQEGNGTLSLKSFRAAFRDACNQAGLPEEIVPHSLRHGFATALLQADVKVPLVQELLGHADIATTQIYLHLTEPMRKELRPRLDGLCRDLGLPFPDFPQSDDQPQDDLQDGGNRHG